MIQSFTHGNEKYKTALGSKFFELMFLMKSQLIRRNSILFVIGYSGNDKHLNEIISDSIEAGLCVIWFNYSKKENDKDILLPEDLLKHKEKIIIIDQLSEPIGTVRRCSNIIKEVLDENR